MKKWFFGPVSFLVRLSPRKPTHFIFDLFQLWAYFQRRSCTHIESDGITLLKHPSLRI